MKRWVQHFREVRVAQHYRKIVKLENKLGASMVAAELRRDFTADSFRTINRTQRENGVPRGKRRRWQRQVAKSK